MTEFFLQYGLFAAKFITVVAVFVLVIGFILSAAAARNSRSRENLEIINVNEKLEDLKESIQSEILSKHELKALDKERKQQDKKDKKEEKARLKSGETEPSKPRLFVIRFEGDLHASEVENLRDSITTILTVAKHPDEVLVIVESSGGVVHNYGLAASQLVRVKQHGIRLTISVDLVAASGGYMMACVGDEIIAAPFAVLGSIGVLAEVPNFHRLLKRFDVDVEHHTAGEYKTTLTMLGKNTDKGREKFQEELEEVHVLFKNFVSENRPILDINKIATGEAWYGSQALQLKLVDKLQTSDDFLVEKSANADVFEVSFSVTESIRDKINAMISKSVSTIIDQLSYKLSRKNVQL